VRQNYFEVVLLASSKSKDLAQFWKTEELMLKNFGFKLIIQKRKTPAAYVLKNFICLIFLH